MALETAAVLRHMNAVLAEAENITRIERTVTRTHKPWIDTGAPRNRSYKEASSADLSRANLLILSALKKYAPPGSPYMEQANAVLKRCGPSNDHGRELLIGMLRALRFEYETGVLQSVVELVHADLFADFLEMARYLLDKRFKDPAAVLAAGVLEQHLRGLAEKHGVPLQKENGDPKSGESINQDLMRAGAFDTATLKQVTAKLELRNSAAHGEWHKYEHKQVAMFIEWVSFFLQKYPA